MFPSLVCVFFFTAEIQYCKLLMGILVLCWTCWFPSAVHSAEMSFVACLGYWQRPCKTPESSEARPQSTSDSPPWLLLTSSVVNRVAAEHLFDQYNMLSVCCCDATHPLVRFPSLHCRFPSTCITVSDCYEPYRYCYTSVIGERLRAVWDTRVIIWPDSI